MQNLECMTDHNIDNFTPIIRNLNIEEGIKFMMNLTIYIESEDTSYSIPNEKTSQNKSSKWESPSENSNQLEIYFSWHERMVNTNNSGSEQTVFRDRSFLNTSVKDFRDFISMPDLWRTTLVDQIDYDLDGYKINESSMSSGSTDQTKFGIPCITKQQFWKAQAPKDMVEDIQPKFIEFLNEGYKDENEIPSNIRQNHNHTLPNAPKRCSQNIRDQFEFKSNVMFKNVSENLKSTPYDKESMNKK